jgi:exodeoxyribonuclease-3
MSKTLNVATINVNGIRAAHRKGLGEWLKANEPDILTLQEVRAELVDVQKIVDEIWSGANIFMDEATAKGRAGVAVISKMMPTRTSTQFGADDFDSKGRWLEADFEVNGKTITVVSTYVHAGEVDTPKQVEKYKFLDAMLVRLAELNQKGSLAVITGDLNVGHTELDIKNWKGNLKNSGFLAEERAYFDRFMGELGYKDVGREAHPGEPGPYTWWSQRGQAFDTNTGWRIDYHLATPELAQKASNYQVHRAKSYDTRWTDHSPVTVDYSI